MPRWAWITLVTVVVLAAVIVVWSWANTLR
jgi:hypothetical protein